MLVHADNTKFQVKPTGEEIGGIKKRFTKSASIKDLTAKQIVDYLTAGKTIQPGVTPFSERNRQKGKKGTCGDDFKQQRLFMSDIDNKCRDIPLETPAHVAEVLKGYNLPLCFAYDTFNSTETQERFRIGLVCEEDITAEAERMSIQSALIKCFPQSDPDCINADRIFFGTNKGVCAGIGDVAAVCKKADLLAFAEAVHNTGGGETEKLKFGEPIPTGLRHNTLVSFAGTALKKYGDCKRAFDLYMQRVTQCEEPMPDSEIEAIWQDACKHYEKVVCADPEYIPPEEFAQDFEKEMPPFVLPTKYGERLSAPLLADYYLERHKVIVVTDSGNPRMYEYCGGAYLYRTELSVKGTLGEYVKAYSRDLWQSAKVFEAYTAIIQTPSLHIEQKQLNADPNIVCLKNGLLNLKEWKLYPHSPDVYFTTQLDIDFAEPIPATPVYDSSLQVYCEGSEGKRQFIMQYQGAIFSNVPGSKFKRFLLTIGNTDSGKTILKRFTEIIVGEGNYNNCDLADLESNNFAAASLHLKRLSGTNDLRAVKISEAGRLLQLTGGDSMRVERKGEQDFPMIYTGFIWHVGNHKPIYGGRQNEALYTREILFEIKHTIPPEKQDHHLLEKLLEEKQGIVLKCLYAARKAIYENDYRFDVPPECERSKAEHKHSNNIVSQFMEECTLPLELKGMHKSEAEKHTAAKVWQAFKRWREDCGEYKGTTRNDFESELAAVCGTEVESIKTLQRSGGIVGRYYPVMLNDTGKEYNGDIYL